MFRMALVLAALLGVASIAAVGALGQQTMSAPKLNGETGPGFKIEVTRNGKDVKMLTAGKYTFVVQDKSTIHSFALDGPHGFAKDFTTVPFKGTKTVTINLKAGRYKYYCAAHEATMFGHFTVK
jgi:hypothetical protein